MSDTPVSASSDRSTPVNLAIDDEDDVIQIKTLVSSTKGDLRRTSFITTVGEQALATYGITCKDIFSGGEFMVMFR